MRFLLVPACCLQLLGSLSAQFSTAFETVNASPTGTPTAGQDGFYVPAVFHSIDGKFHTYAGNMLGVPPNPDGGNQFWAGTSPGGAFESRSERLVSLPTGRTRVEFDVCCTFVGTGTPTNFLGSVSVHPTATTHALLVAAYPAAASSPPSSLVVNCSSTRWSPNSSSNRPPSRATPGGRSRSPTIRR
jgi:hypothetical protein